MGDAARRLVLAKNLPLSMSLGTTDKSQARLFQFVDAELNVRPLLTSRFGVGNGSNVGGAGRRLHAQFWTFRAKNTFLVSGPS